MPAKTADTLFSMASKCLPSGDVARDLITHPSLENAAKVVGSMLVRGAAIGAGIYLAGGRGSQLLAYTTGGMLVTEAGVLAWGAWSLRKRKNPLRKGKSKAAFRHNVALLRREGRSRDQALAISYRQQRES
jgi:hypothetical protein